MRKKIFSEKLSPYSFLPVKVKASSNLVLFDGCQDYLTDITKPSFVTLLLADYDVDSQR